MKIINFDTRKLIIFSIVDFHQLKLINDPFAIIIESNENGVNIEIKELLDIILNKHCSEICIVGKFADELHDYIDEKIENKELLHIITTSLSSDTIDEICDYFFEVSGSKPSTLLAICNSKELIDGLKCRINANN